VQLSAVQCDDPPSESRRIIHVVVFGLSGQKLFYRLCQQDYWEFLQQCEDTGIERMTKLVQQEQDKWIAKYDEAMELFKSQSGSSGSLGIYQGRSKLTLHRWRCTTRRQLPYPQSSEHLLTSSRSIHRLYRLMAMKMDRLPRSERYRPRQPHKNPKSRAYGLKR
jgi:hypothetical protein